MVKNWVPRRRKKRAVIIGGSMSGLFCAAFLRQVGWDVDVYERSRVELVGRGAGITTHPELLNALEKCGAGTQRLGVTVEKRITIDRSGRVIGERQLRQILTSWDRLQSLLRTTIDSAHYHLGQTFSHVEQDANGVTVYFAEGAIERADLLIGADGIRSKVRSIVAPQAEPIYAGYYIWRFTPEEADLKPSTRESIFPYYAFYLPERQQVLGYPIVGANHGLRAGQRRYNVIWYRVGDATKLREMCIDAQGRQHQYSIPPTLIREEVVAEMLADAEAIMPPPFVDCVRKTALPFFTPVYDFAAQTFVSGRVVLVGDAAATARPHMGFGVSKAAGDAEALADALGRFEQIQRGLATYNSQRQPYGERIVKHGRKLGTHLGVDLMTKEDRRNWQFLKNDQAMMDSIAVPNFLAAPASRAPLDKHRPATHAVAEVKRRAEDAALRVFGL
jgi:2-polyprenyl-6-methoxyphenol hydroxylase-like FAD-dependent oxidoreductase